MKKSTLFILLSILLFGACTEKRTDAALPTPEDETATENAFILNPMGWNLDLKIDFTSYFDLNEEPLDSLVGLIATELFEAELTLPAHELQPASGETVFVEAALLISAEQLILTPITGVESISASGDDKNCGGADGDGWKSYGTCKDEICVEKLIREATDDLRPSLKIGKCLDIRVRRTLLSARVCARIVPC